MYIYIMSLKDDSKSRPSPPTMEVGCILDKSLSPWGPKKIKEVGFQL